MFGQFLAQNTSSVADRILSAAGYFQNPTLNLPQIAILLTLLAAVVAGIFLVRAVFKYRLAKAVYIPPGDIHDAAKIFNILDYCILRRNKMEFKITGRHNSGQLVSGMPTELKEGRIILAMSVPFGANHQRLAGEKIHCYFRVLQEGHDVFLNFFSEIELVRQGDSGFLELDITMPEALLAGQKRNFLRIDPPTDFILEIAIWPEYLSDETDWRSSLDDFPDPLLKSAEGEAKFIKLSDISAGGAGMTVDRSGLGASTFSFAKGRRFMLRLVLWDPTDEREVPIWLVCRTQKLVTAAGTQEIEIGVQFIAWSQLKKAETRELRWLTLESDDEVPPLGDWVVKRYLEHYRTTLVD